MKDQDVNLRIAGIVRESIVDGPGIRFVVFCQGCPHHCPGCHNPVTHDFNGGYDCSIEKLVNAIDENPLLDGVTFSGGEPVCQAEGFCRLARRIKERDLDIVLYSGYTYEELQMTAGENQALKDLLELTDILIDGPYDQSQRDLTLPFRGSRNQRPIALNETRRQGKIVLSEKISGNL